MANKQDDSKKIASKTTASKKQNAGKKVASKTLKVTWVKSTIGYNKRQSKIIEALGFKRLNQTRISSGQRLNPWQYISCKAPS